MEMEPTPPSTPVAASAVAAAPTEHTAVLVSSPTEDGEAYESFLSFTRSDGGDLDHDHAHSAPQSTHRMAYNYGESDGDDGEQLLLTQEEPSTELEQQLADVSAVHPSLSLSPLPNPLPNQPGYATYASGNIMTANAGNAGSNRSANDISSQASTPQHSPVPPAGVGDMLMDSSQNTQTTAPPLATSFNGNIGGALSHTNIGHAASAARPSVPPVLATAPRVPTFDLDSPTDTADDTDLIGLFSADGKSKNDNHAKNGTAKNGQTNGHDVATPAPSARGTHNERSSQREGRMDVDRSGLRLEMDGLSGYESHGPAVDGSSNNSNSNNNNGMSNKWDEGRLTKSSSGGYPLQSSADAKEEGEREYGLPDFVRKAQRQNQMHTQMHTQQHHQQQNQQQQLNNDGGMQPQEQPKRRRPRPWDDLNETSYHDDDDDEEEIIFPQNHNRKNDAQEQPDGGYVHFGDLERGGANGSTGTGTGLTARIVPGTFASPTSTHVPPGALQDQPRESTPLLSRQQRKHHHHEGWDDNRSQVSSWSSVGASMRFRNPLARGRTGSGTSNGNGNGNGNGVHNGNGSSSQYAASSTADTDATGHKSLGSAVMRWRGAGAALTTTPRGAAGRNGDDDDDRSWTAGSVVKEFLHHPFRRDGRERDRASVAGTSTSGGGGGGGGTGLLRDLALGRASSFGYAHRPQNQAWFSFGLSLLLVVHFALMAFYDVVKLYYAYENEAEGRPLWISSAGLIANPLFGPPASTLTTFGAISGVRLLLSSEIWRVLTSLTLSTSLTQVILNLSVLRFGAFAGYFPTLERRWSSTSALALYIIVSICGAVSCIALDYPADVTGLVAAGLCGLLSVSLAEGWLSAVREMRSDRLGQQMNRHDYNAGIRSGIVKIVFRPGRAHLYIGLELFLGLFAHTSLWSIIGAIFSGLGCGLFHFSYILDNKDDRPKADAYGPAFGSPSRKKNEHGHQGNTGMFGTPTHSPSPSETPPIRRPIMVDDPDTTPRYAGDASSPYSPYRTPGRNGSYSETNNASGVGTARSIGFSLALMTMLIPGILVAMGDTIDQSMLKNSIYGCRSMRKVFAATYGHVDSNAEGDDVTFDYSEDISVCSQSCVPTTLTWKAKISQNFTMGRCNNAGYQCLVGIGDNEIDSGRWWVPPALRFNNATYSLPVKIYTLTDAGNGCMTDEDEGSNIDANDAAANEEQMEAEEQQMQVAYSTGAKDLAIQVLETVAANSGI